MAIFVPRFVRQLRDVLLSSPADGEVLAYDDADGKWKNSASAGGGVTDHGALTGLADDDHPQYTTTAEAQALVDVHVTDATDAHDASAVSVVPFGTIAATQVQAALEEIVGEAVSDLGPAVILAPASSARNVIVPTAGTVIATVTRAHAAQSVNLAEWQLSSAALAWGLSKGGSEVLAAVAAPADGDIPTSQRWQWYESTVGAPGIYFAQRDSAGTLFTGKALASRRDGSYSSDYSFVQPADGFKAYDIIARFDGTALQNRLWYTGYYTAEFEGDSGYGYILALKGLANFKSVDAGQTLGAAVGVQAEARTDPASTADVDYLSAIDAVSHHYGTGDIPTGMYGLVSYVVLHAGAGNPGPMVGANARVLNEHATFKVAEGTGLLIDAPGVSNPAAGFTDVYGVSISNQGVAGITNSYALRIAAQSGATNVYGIYVAGGKSLFVDSLITGKIALPADADFANGQGAWWWDQANSLPKWKGKTSGGTVVNATPYTVSGTDVALADGGTGVSLVDPNADRIMFWDDSAGAVTWLTPGTNLTITGTTLDATAGAGGAPTDASYVTVNAEAGLSAETLYTALKLDDFAAPDDNTDLNVSTTKHGLTPKLSNVATEYLSGTGVYSVPAGAGGVSSTDNLFLTRYLCKR